MSYILDALNKSETERRAASLPGMAGGASFMVAPQRSSSRRGSAAILVGVGMLVTGLALGSWRPWQNIPVPPPGELAAAAPQPAAQPAPVETPAPASPAAKAVAKPVAQLKPQPTVPVVTKPKAPPKPPVTVQAEAPAPAAVGVESQPKAAKADKATKADKADKADKAAKADRADKVAAAEAAAPANRVVAYRELPAKVQSRLPAISFGGFAGVDESEVKIAFINNRLVKEGEEVSPGLKLEKVGNDGVVLAYQGHRFRP